MGLKLYMAAGGARVSLYMAAGGDLPRLETSPKQRRPPLRSSKALPHLHFHTQAQIYKFNAVP